MATAKNPPGPPMTLGNMRLLFPVRPHIDFVAVAAALAALIAAVALVCWVAAEPVCWFPP
jgi:hypothetical protein